MKENENFNEMTKMTDYCGICHAELVSASFQQTDTDKTLKQVQGDEKSSVQGDEKRVAFTLAETLITLSILGIVAAITVPALVGRQIENQNRTKLKKAMTMYEKAINNMLIENDLQTEDSFKAWAKKDATTNSYQEQLGYFKIAEMSTKEGATSCRFKTSDRIWWDICGTNDSNIENAIVILDEKYKDTDRSELETLAKTEKVDGKKVYVYALVGRRDATTGAVRIDDKAYEEGQENNTAYQQEIEKLYAFIEKREMKTADGDSGNSGICNGADSCEKDGLSYKKMSFSDEPTTINLSGNDTSTSVATGDKYVTVVESGNGKSWNDAQSLCPDGTHLAKAAEIKQMWNDGASGNVLESSCDSCSGENSPRFWAAETNSSNTDRAYAFAILRGNGMTLSGLKTNTNSVNHVICVEN